MQVISDIKRIQHAKANNKLVIFVGAGVSNNSGVPDWGNLIDEFKKELPIDEIAKEKDSLKTAEYYFNFRGHKEYLEKIKEVLKYGKVSYNPIHNVILDLEPSHIITTNYDDLIEQSIKPRNLQYHIIKKDSDLPYIQTDHLVIKMHGDFDSGNIVLKEKDYLSYSKNFPLIETFVKSLFATKFVLFVGFSFSDYNLRFILNQIQTLLQDDFQPVYMLVNEPVNYVVKDYYKKKGINLIEITGSTLEKLIQEQEIDLSEIESLEKTVGKVLYQQLRLIVDYQEKRNLIDHLHLNLIPLQKEIPVLGDGLKYFFPKKEKICWNLHSSGLQIKSPYIQSLLSNKDSLLKYKFLKKYGSKLRDLAIIAFYNNIYQIDEVPLYTKSLHKIINRHKNQGSITLFQRGDYDGVLNNIKALTKKKLTYTHYDLELPLTLYITGNYYEAYKKYKELSEKYWEKKNYILYFISVYNQKMVGYLASSDANKNSFANNLELKKEADKIDLSAILWSCPLQKEIKYFLSDLVFDKHYLKFVKSINDLMLKLYDDKKRADNGGNSLNNHAALLISNIYRLINFGNINYIVCLDNEYSQQCFKNAVSGILLNHTTKLNNDEIDNVQLSIFLCYIRCVDLKEIFNRYDIQTISLSNDAKSYIIQLLDNLLKNRNNSIELIQNCSYFDVFQNLVFILIKTPEQIDKLISEKLYGVFLKYKLFNGKLTLTEMNSCSELFDLMSVLIDKNNPSQEISIKLLNPILKLEKDRWKPIKYVKSISNVLVNSRFVFEEIKDISQLNYSGRLDWGYLSGLYPIVAIKVKKQILHELQNLHNSIENQIVADIYTDYDIPIFNVDVLERYLSSVNRMSIYYTNLLLKVRQDKRCKSVHSKIDAIIKTNEYLKFIKNPIKYTNYSLIKPEWLIFCGESDFRKVIQIQIVNKKVKSSFETEEWYVEQLKKKYLLYG